MHLKQKRAKKLIGNCTMKITGKILFFNQQNGEGILITSTKKKFEFFIKDWDDFDVMPSLGLEVTFEAQENSAKSIVAKSTFDAIEKENSFLDDTVEWLQNEQIEDFEIDKNTIFNDELEKERESEISEVMDIPDDVVIFPDEDEKVNSYEITIEGVAKEIVQQEIAPREDSITLSFNLSTAVTNYFDSIKKHIAVRQNYKKISGRLDYLIARRFIWTAYNNLSEIDINVITPKIKIFADDLKIMWRIYDDFNNQARNPSLAFGEVFLSCQAQYKKIKDGVQIVQEKLNVLRTNEQMIYARLRVKKEELDKNIKSEEFELLKHELKSLNGTYVDVVHMMAELDERHKHDLELLYRFEEEYRNDFYEIFERESTKYRHLLVEILNAQAFIFDMHLWNQAKNSKSIRAYFKRAGIIGELNTKTYLKYYLESIDSSKASIETKKLFELYEYLRSTHKEHIVVVAADARDVVEYVNSIKKVGKNYYVKSFIDEKSAIKWAINNSVKVLVLEENLQNTSAARFLEIYSNNVLLSPKIILIGDKPKLNDSITINKLLSKNTSLKIIAQNVKSLYDEK